MVRAALISSGDELLRGFVRDAHLVWLGDRMRRLGVHLDHAEVHGDDAARLTGVIAAAAQHSDLLIVTGGLGPTHDDRTSEVVAAVVGEPLEVDEQAQGWVERRVHGLARTRGETDMGRYEEGIRKQALMPRGSVPVEPAGTAPGYAVRAGECVIVVLPGPPFEMRDAWTQLEREPVVAELLARATRVHERVVRAWGLPESHVADLLREAGHRDSGRCRVTLCARMGELELSVRGDDVGTVDALVERLVEGLGAHVFAVDDERSLAALVGDRLAGAGQMLAVAESCTGGMLGAQLTAVAGSSGWFVGGVVSYANDVKERMLGVPALMLEEHGAVSEQVARAMAEGVRERLGADIGVAITGVAGPGGGTADKPVGTVWIARAQTGATRATLLQLYGDRGAIRERSCAAAMHMLLGR